MNRDTHQSFNTGKQILRHRHLKLKTGQIVASDQSGDRHEAEQRRVYQVDQIVAGIDRSKTEQQGNTDVETTRPSQLQANGTATLSSTDCNTSFLSIVS